MHKSKNHAKKLVTSMLIAILLISSIPISVSAQNTVTVSPECEFQTFKGWGTSLSWWGNAIGGWQNKTFRSKTGVLFEVALSITDRKSVV